METIEFIFCTFLFAAAWHLILRKSFLDQARDQLFDIRDGLRSTFVKNGWDLNSTSYRQARDLVNSHLRFIEERSAWQIMYMQAGVASNHELSKTISKRFDSLFADLPKEQVDTVQKVRRDSLRIVLDFAVSNSFPLACIGIFLLPIILAERLIRSMRLGAKVFKNAIHLSFTHLGATFGNLVRRAADVVANWFFKPAVIEHYSMRYCT